jgi:hypothetical protein
LRKLLLQSELSENHFHETPAPKVFANLFKGGFIERFLKRILQNHSQNIVNSLIMPLLPRLGDTQTSTKSYACH